MFLNMIVLFTIWTFIKFYKKKLMALLMMELLFLVNILILSTNSTSSVMSIFIMISISIFMVLDSVMGISILMSMTRNSSTKSFNMNSF